ncbi:MAG: glycosyltransferase [Ruminococcus sp.]|uniref:glycosyltransferase family 2 protein n=1 Tax=Ruminococcus callidus TaxID=40519 RepID=UPI001D01C37A|nr:glycosyltransferase family 2 protein [Ruminococcus callidus]MCB5775438.1 glycosyltransferase family 2 protein [Ruminococcus callidus]MCC2759079.1 glycosyltransferase family 2 protein [Ruminococcus callidus]
MNCIYFVIPCYNEQEVLPITAEQLRIKYDQLLQSGLIAESSRILLVDDGSKDRTWQIISQLHQKDSRFQGVKLSRNRGHQNALLAGLMTARSFCDAAISLDADLQDDINAMDAMLQKFQDGCDIVYGVRSDRETDTVFKRYTAQGYYKFMSGMGGELVYNHADYRLMSRRALDGLAEFGEVNLFLRGIVPMIGYRSDIVTYARKERPAGKSKYPLKKMLAFAWEGLTSLSIRPIRMITILGTLIFLVSIGMLIYSVIRHAMGATITGWTSLAVSIWAIGGLQLLAIGIIGEYIGKVYLETKSRPKYIIETYLGDSESK